MNKKEEKSIDGQLEKFKHEVAQEMGIQQRNNKRKPSTNKR
ncbi:small, acid-soluble spore protein, alpha/beta type [Metallumcola ferriviriculae]